MTLEIANKRKIILVRHNAESGFLSYVYLMFNAMCYLAEKFGDNFIPIVDMKSSKNYQFHTSQSLNKINIYENIFEQPYRISLDDVNQSECDVFNVERCYVHFNILKHIQLDKIKNYVIKFLHFKKDILDKAENFYKHYMSNNTVGVLFRGTDRSFRCYKNHTIAPLYVDSVNKFDLYYSECKPDKIFLMTESEKIFSDFKARYPLTVSYQTIHLPEIHKSISQIIKDKQYEYKQQLIEQYVISLLLLIKCRHVIAMTKNSAYDMYKILRFTQPKSSIEL